MPDCMVQRYIIELLECGVWEAIDEAFSHADALELASHYCDVWGEDRVRLSTPDNSIL